MNFEFEQIICRWSFCSSNRWKPPSVFLSLRCSWALCINGVNWRSAVWMDLCPDSVSRWCVQVFLLLDGRVFVWVCTEPLNESLQCVCVCCTSASFQLYYLRKLLTPKQTRITLSQRQIVYCKARGKSVEWVWCLITDWNQIRPNIFLLLLSIADDNTSETLLLQHLLL